MRGRVKKKIKKIINKVILIILAIEIIFMPIFSETSNIVIDKTNTETSLDKAQNGVDIVNINSPSSRGVSHNKIEEYNVSESGVILNKQCRIRSYLCWEERHMVILIILMAGKRR